MVENCGKLPPNNPGQFSLSGNKMFRWFILCPLSTDDTCPALRNVLKVQNRHTLVSTVQSTQFLQQNFNIEISFQEISFDVFLQVIWEDSRIKLRESHIEAKYIELKLEERHKLWVNLH